ncbi:hypothetical protein LQK30_001417 [Vibrio vulnificus]|nr:hypothetical protein [Vibrio vulnificus]ELH9431176.1 hypothetical protein [Vibrio vulnificus]
MNSNSTSNALVSSQPDLLPLYCLLEDETTIPTNSINARYSLYKEFRAFPQEVFARLRHFQPQSGCFNKCNFCSQGASSRIIEFSLENLRNIIAVIKAVSLEQNYSPNQITDVIDFDTGHFIDSRTIHDSPLIAYGREDRRGVIYCYLDNDPAIYPHIDTFARLVYENLGVKTRIATVGYSRHNQPIRQAFTNLSSSLRYCLAGVRLSISPYTYGWTEAGMRAGATHRDEFEKDLAHFLDTFKNTGALFSAELRFRPMVDVGEVELTKYFDIHILTYKNYLYVSDTPLDTLTTASISDSHDHALKMDTPGHKVIQLELKGNWRKSADLYLRGKLAGTPCLIHKLQNEDGIYFGVNVERNQAGKCYAKFFYPKSIARPNSGHIDGERYLLNAIIDTKATTNNASWQDIDALIQSIKNKARTLACAFQASSNYIEKDLIPLIDSFVRTLKIARLPANSFLDKELTMDTGQICNLGRAYNEYKFLASRQDLPMTPNHERAFGKKGDLANEGTVFRLSPGGRQRISNKLGRTYTKEDEFIIEELDLTSTSSEDGQSKQHYKFFLPGNVIKSMKQLDEPIIVGQIPTRVTYE